MCKNLNCVGSIYRESQGTYPSCLWVCGWGFRAVALLCFHAKALGSASIIKDKGILFIGDDIDLSTGISENLK